MERLVQSLGVGGIEALPQGIAGLIDQLKSRLENVDLASKFFGLAGSGGNLSEFLDQRPEDLLEFLIQIDLLLRCAQILQVHTGGEIRELFFQFLNLQLKGRDLLGSFASLKVGEVLILGDLALSLDGLAQGFLTGEDPVECFPFFFARP